MSNQGSDWEGNPFDRPSGGGTVTAIAPGSLELLIERQITEKPVSHWGLAWRRLKRHKLAMIGLVVIILVVILSALAPLIAPYDYEVIDLNHSFAPFFSRGEPGQAMHYLGTDKLGRDILSRLLYAGRISLVVALSVTLASITIGMVIGAVAGSFGRATETMLMRFTDVMLTLPTLPLLLVLSSSLRQYAQIQDFLGSNSSVLIIILILVVFGWMNVTRLVHSSVLSLRSQEFVQASRALGAGQYHIIFRHLLPNSLAPIIVSATLAFGGVIIAESALSFLGFGIMPPVPTWGNMLNEARNSPLQHLFIQALSPGFCIFITVLSINFIGDGLRDALDPRLKM
jgi:peptide/nickel transport system permease protein